MQRLSWPLAGVDRRGSALLLSLAKLWHSCRFLVSAIVVFPKKSAPFVPRSFHEAEIGLVFVLCPPFLFPIVERAAGTRGAAVAHNARPKQRCSTKTDRAALFVGRR